MYDRFEEIYNSITMSSSLQRFFSNGDTMKLRKKSIRIKKIAVALSAMVVTAVSAISAAAADPIVISYTLEHEVLTAMDVDCAPSGIIRTADNAILVTDTYSKKIWKVQDGVCSVYAGAESVKSPYQEPLGGYNDSAHEKSLFREPWGIAPFLDGYAVSDAGNSAVRLLRSERTETVNADTQERLVMNDMGVVYANPTGLAADESGNLYVSDTNNGAVRVISPDGYVRTLAERLETPTGICWYKDALYVVETGANRVLKIYGNGKVEIIAGSGTDGYVDGPATSAAFSAPQGITVGPDGTVYISDTANGAVRRIRGNTVETLAIRSSSALRSYPVSPRGLCVMDNKLYVCDNFSKKIFIISL